MPGEISVQNLTGLIFTDEIEYPSGYVHLSAYNATFLRIYIKSIFQEERILRVSFFALMLS